ncbi:hypothetical protein M5V91_24555 [Cytobacillus pseudoceanisediminis]|uniref:hypothetical protein n=1 Tax=Cytobacillus pseudoceanisediminis TaxID=3051614 RepID=UPI002186C95C|nr:hypothetical protein [Cytobacillus pseudoceanisediminis]UQX53822.1 hypothetical protein M5V91_24555 [Cytobacillus pseudoceanisediminis]
MDEINSQDGENTTKDTAEYNSQQLELTKIKNNLNQAQKIANIGSLEYDIENDRGFWSDQLFRIFGLKPQKGFFRTTKCI